MIYEDGFFYDENFRLEEANSERDIVVATLQQDDCLAHLLKCSDGDGKNYYLIDSFVGEDPVDMVDAPDGVERMTPKEVKALLADVNQKNMEDARLSSWKNEIQKESKSKEDFLSIYRSQQLPLIFQTSKHDRGCIITESTREGQGPCQISFFDSKGFTSHQCGTLEKCLSACVFSMGIPEPMPQETYEMLSAQPKFQSAALVAQYVYGWDDMDSPSAKQLAIEFAEQPTSECTPQDIYRWLYKRGMEALDVKALPTKEGFGANIDMKTRLKLSGYVFQSKEWNRLPKKDRQEGILAEPCLDKNVLKKLGAQPAR